MAQRVKDPAAVAQVRPVFAAVTISIWPGNTFVQLHCQYIASRSYFLFPALGLQHHSNENPFGTHVSTTWGEIHTYWNTFYQQKSFECGQIYQVLQLIFFCLTKISYILSLISSYIAF